MLVKSLREHPLVVIETHPIQYRAPVYRVLSQSYQIPITVVYGSDFSVAGYYDPEFRSAFAWDTDLLTGYAHMFLARVENGGAKTYDAVSARGLPGILDRLNPKAVLLVGYSPRFHQWAWLHALRSRRPILFRGETTNPSQPENTIRSRLRAGLLRGVYRHCSRFLYIGQQSREHFSRHGCPDEKLIFSPYCVDSSPFQTDEGARERLRGAARMSLGLDETAMVILFSGKLSERKGPDLLIEAVRGLQLKDRARTTVVFLGSGEMMPALEALASHEPRVSVRFLGFRNQKLMSQWFHASDIFVLPSRRSETWGLVVNEALHHGLPCVTSDAVGCAPDLVTTGLTGEIFESGSVVALTNAIVRARSLAREIQIREACRARIAGYSIDKAAEGIAKAYEAAVH